jgi:hypothetical protein
MADTKGFDAYFGGRSLLTGVQSPSGDYHLTLRAGTVFQENFVYNKAYAGFSGVAVETPTNADGVWVPIANTLIQGPTTPTFTFAANQFTYIGPNQLVQTSLRASISGQSVGTGYYEVGIFVNDLLVGNPMQTAFDAGVRYLATEVQRVLVTGDVIDMRVRPVANVNSITLLNGQLVIG